MKATFNIKTRILHVTGKEIYSLRMRLKVGECGDWWHSVNSKETGNPIYDINLWHDDFVQDGGKWDNPKNWKMQYVGLRKNEKSIYLENDGDYKVMKMKVKRK